MPQHLGGRLCLRTAKIGQSRIDDPRVFARGCKVQVELALTVAEEDHASGT